MQPCSPHSTTFTTICADATFDYVTGDLLVLDAQGAARELLDERATRVGRLRVACVRPRPRGGEAKEAALRLNTHNDEGAGVERQGYSGLNERGHAYREKAPSEMEKLSIKAYRIPAPRVVR
jgi:hypothetical protein